MYGETITGPAQILIFLLHVIVNLVSPILLTRQKVNIALTYGCSWKKKISLIHIKPPYKLLASSPKLAVRSKRADWATPQNRPFKNSGGQIRLVTHCSSRPYSGCRCYNVEQEKNWKSTKVLRQLDCNKTTKPEAKYVSTQTVLYCFFRHVPFSFRASQQSVQRFGANNFAEDLQCLWDYRWNAYRTAKVR